MEKILVHSSTVTHLVHRTITLAQFARSIGTKASLCSVEQNYQGDDTNFAGPHGHFAQGGLASNLTTPKS